MSVHRYARPAINADLARAGLGVAACALPIALAGLGPVATAIFAVPLVLFAGFGLRTALRLWTLVGFDEHHVSVKLPGRAPTRLAWDRLEAVKLGYFSTRRDREQGWMTLSLRGPGARFTFDDSLYGFEAIARQAWTAARDRGIDMSPATLRNFAALGVAPAADGGERANPLTSGWGAPSEWRR